MAYTDTNYKSKKQLILDVKEGKLVTVFNPGLGDDVKDGKVYLEGPHYPEPHKWYAEGIVKDGKLVKVK
jgi:hypothetical protein